MRSSAFPAKASRLVAVVIPVTSWRTGPRTRKVAVSAASGPGHRPGAMRIRSGLAGRIYHGNAA